MTTLEQIKKSSSFERQITSNTIESITTKNPPKTLLEKIGDQALKSVINEKRSEFEGSDTLYGVYATYEQMERVSKLLRASVCYKMALKKRSTPTTRKNSSKKKTSKKIVSKRSKTRTNRSKAKS